MKLQLNQKDLFNKMFVLGFVWLTPMSLVGILRSSIVWSLVNGIDINIPWLNIQQQQELTETIEDILSQEESVGGETEESVNRVEESIGSSPEEVDETSNAHIEVITSGKKGWGFKN